MIDKNKGKISRKNSGKTSNMISHILSSYWKEHGVKGINTLL